jgi:ribosomal protein S17E
VAPLYRDNQTLIQKYTEQIEKLFDKNSEALKSKVASSAGESMCSSS